LDLQDVSKAIKEELYFLGAGSTFTVRLKSYGKKKYVLVQGYWDLPKKGSTRLELSRKRRELYKFLKSFTKERNLQLTETCIDSYSIYKSA
jgi:hypothetical protein